MGAQGIGRPHHAVFSHRRRSADGQIVGADHLRGEQLRQQWSPPLSEMEGKGRFGVGGAVKAEIFLEGGPDRRRYLIPAHNAGTGKSLRQSLFPRGQHRQSLPKHGFPSGGLYGVHQLVFLHPLLPGKLIFRFKKRGSMGLPQCC